MRMKISTDEGIDVKLIIYSIGLVLWIAYAITIKNGPVALMNSIGLLLSLSILYLKNRYELKEK